MENLLQEWGLENLITTFNENDITMENIVDITDDHLKELKVSIGHRIIFKNKMKLYKDRREAKGKENEQNILNMDMIFEDQQSDETKSSILSETDTETNTADISIASTNTAETSNANEIILPDAINVESHFLHFDLKNLLITSPYGNTILKYYANNNSLNFSLRAKLVNIIARYLYTYILKHRLTHSQFLLITSKIISLFPNESSCTYYTPAIPKNQSPIGKSVMARGKLVDKCRNMLYKSADKDYVRKRKSETSSDEVEETILDKDIESDVSWLKYNIEPWTEVLEKWNKTFEIRKTSKTINFHTFLKEWAPLNHKDKAECLINIDFNLLFPDKNLKLFQDWDSFIDKVVNLNKRTEANIQDLINNRQSITSEDGRFINDIYLLANIIPPKGRILIRTNFGRKQWKFSTIESIEAIIVHCKSPNDIERVIEVQKEKALNRKQSYAVQPYILFEGPSLHEMRTSYIIIDGNMDKQMVTRTQEARSIAIKNKKKEAFLQAFKGYVEKCNEEHELYQTRVKNLTKQFYDTQQQYLEKIINFDEKYDTLMQKLKKKNIKYENMKKFYKKRINHLKRQINENPN